MKKMLNFFFVSFLFSNVVMGQDDSLDASFANPTNLTDQKANNAKEFVHSGVRDRKIKEGCAQKELTNCQMKEGGMDLESIIGKAYSLIFGGMMGMGGGGPSFTKNVKAPATTTPPPTPPAGTTAAKVKPETKSSPDYCMYGAMAYETLGGMIQQGLQKKADGAAAGAGDVQLQALVSLKETHKARKTTATWQSGVYGAISACYGAMAFTGINLDWKYWAKLGGAVALTGLYMKKAKKHGDAAKKVQLVIDSLPKTGTCNPWTGTTCFCKEITSRALYPAEYQEVCVLNGGNFDTPKVALGCGTVVDKKMQYDKDCECKKNNTCFKTIIGGISPKFEFGTNLMNSANKGFDLLSDGNIDQARLNGYSTDASALAGRMKSKKDLFPKSNLTDEQKKIAGELGAHMSPSLANLAAGSGDAFPAGGIKDAASTSASVSKLSDDLKEKLGEAIDTNYRVGGSGIQSGAVDEQPFSIAGMPGQEGGNGSGTEIVSFAEEAVSKADVSNAPETPLFDIISNRYRNSAWKKLDTDGK